MKPDILCQGLPDEIKQYFNYVRELQFTDEPNYEFLLGLFNNAMKKNNIKNDFKFDWCISTINNNNQNMANQFVSTENLFNKLKLGEIIFKDKTETKDKNKEENDNKINNDSKDKDNKIKLDNDDKNIINEENNNIKEVKLCENQIKNIEESKDCKNHTNTNNIQENQINQNFSDNIKIEK